MFSHSTRQRVPESTFSQSVRQYIQEKAIKAAIDDEHVIDIMLKFCEPAISKTSSLEQQHKQLQGIKILLEMLDCMLTFDESDEPEKNWKRLCNMQKKLSEAVKNHRLDIDGKRNMSVVKTSAAMNSMMELLEKGKENKDTQKLCSGIEAAIKFLEKRKKNILADIGAAVVSNKTSSSKYGDQNRLFSQNSTNSPPVKRARLIDEKTAQEQKEAVQEPEAVESNFSLH
jgi:hypothetical protein